jgi:hypothetical protein
MSTVDRVPTEVRRPTRDTMSTAARKPPQGETPVWRLGPWIGADGGVRGTARMGASLA